MSAFRTFRAAAGAAAASAALLAAAPPTHAAFPGANGLVAAEAPAGGGAPLVLMQENGTAVAGLAPGARDPAFSPRGRRIAFARGGDIWVMDVDGSRARPITSGPADDAQPAWSPGGEALAFASGPAGSRDLYRVRADGSGRQRLTFRPGDDAEPAWSSTDRIAFVRRPRGGAGRGVVHVLTPASFTLQRVSPPRADDGSPAWSPDGRLLAVTRGRSGRRQLVVQAADRSGARTIVGPRQDAAAPAWSPDGQRILFTARADGGRRLLSVAAGGGTPQTLGAAARGARAADWQPGGLDPMIAAAGDIACDPLDPTFNAGRGTVDRCHMRQTSDLMLTMDLDAVLALGDLQNNDGRLVAFQTAFGPNWGRLGGLLHPVPGNHEYETLDAAGYFDFFNGPGEVSGPAGERGEGWYSFDVGAWHIVALNSQCGPAHERAEGTDCAAGSKQEQWLRADLAAHPTACTLAFFHHPRFASGIAGRDDVVLPLWQALHDGGVDVILNGHDHSYERFAPQDPSGTPDADRGIREFVVGTGGHSHQRSLHPEPSSELRDARDFGVLRLTLHPTAYDWAFVTDGGAAVDLGSGPCH
jgi:acid phosphatase type 7